MLNNYPDWYDFFYIELLTGLRRGEICGLKWSDMNFDEGRLHVQRSVNNKKHGGIEIGEIRCAGGNGQTAQQRDNGTKNFHVDFSYS